MSNEHDRSDLENVLIEVFDKIQGFPFLLRPDGTLLDASSKGLELCGISKQEICGAKVWECRPFNQSAETRQRTVQAIELAAQGLDQTVEVGCDASGSRQFNLQVFISPRHDSNGILTHLIGSLKEASGRPDSQRAAAASAQLFHQISESIPHIVWVIRPDLSLEFVSPRLFEFTGANASEYEQQGMFAFIHPEDHARIVESLAGPFQRGEPHEVSYRLRYRDGSFRHVHAISVPIKSADNSLVKWIGTLSDIHDQVLAESINRKQEERLRLATQAASLGIYEWHRSSGELFLSEIIRSTLGLPADQQISLRQLLGMIHREDRASTVNVLRRSMHSTSSDIPPHEFRVMRSDGEIIWVKQYGYSVFSTTDSGYQTERLLGTMIDISTSKHLEAELEKARAAAELASLAKSEFLANMSHEIRTPMTAILGFADLLAERLRVPENLECLDVIRRNGRYLLGLLNDLLDLTKIEAGRMEVDSQRVYLVPLLEDIRTLMEVRATEKKLPLTVSYESQLPLWIESDETRLRQVLVNLIGNAIKFTDRGFVKVSVKVLESESTRTLEFHVIDSGIGIAKDQLVRIFDPFTQADGSGTRRYSGTGLGLAISQRLAKRMGGNLTVSSEPRVGSQFTFSLPLPDRIQLADVPFPLPQKPTPPVTRTLEKVSGRILVVDDQQDVRYALQYFLEKAGASVVTARNGAEAMAEIARSQTLSSPFQIVLMDLQMPVLDGYETVRMIRQSGNRVPVIAISANAMPADRIQCIAAGFDAHLCKPIDWHELTNSINRYLDQPRRINRSAKITSDASEPLDLSTQELPAQEILLVEDHENVREIMKIMLSRRGYTVTMAGSGSEGIEVFNTRRPDIVIMDLCLPDQDGTEVIKAMRLVKDAEQTIFIAMSGFDEERDQARSLAAGFDCHLVKPVDLNVLTQAIARTVAGAKPARVDP